MQNEEDLELDSVTSEISSHEDETIGSSRENVAMGIPTIVTYPPNRELSAVTEESITSSLGVRTPHHHWLEETVIEDPINEQKVKAAKKKIVENFKSFVFINDYPINFQCIFEKLYRLILLKFYYFQESEKSRTRDKNGAVFLTETKAETPGKSPF